MPRLIQNEDNNLFPEELYDEVEEMDTADEFVDYLLATTNLTAEQAEEYVDRYRDQAYEQL